MKNKTRRLNVQGAEIRIQTIREHDYFCISDMVRNLPNSHIGIGNWMRSRSTLEFLGLWEQMLNPDFNLIEFDEVRMASGTNRFTMSPKRWISPEFKLYLIKDYQRLKEWEGSLAKTEWDQRRLFSKINYRLQTDAIERYLLPVMQVNSEEEQFVYANEADVLNVVLFGTTAKAWKAANPIKAKAGQNIRDEASIIQLTILANLEALNSIMIKGGLSRAKRIAQLRSYAKDQLIALLKDARLQSLSIEERKHLGSADSAD